MYFAFIFNLSYLKRQQICLAVLLSFLSLTLFVFAPVCLQRRGGNPTGWFECSSD